MFTESVSDFTTRIKKILSDLSGKIKKFFTEARKKNLKKTDKIDVPKKLHEEIIKFIKGATKLIVSIAVSTVSVALCTKLVSAAGRVYIAHRNYKCGKDSFTKITRARLDEELHSTEEAIKKFQDAANSIDNDPKSTKEERAYAHSKIKDMQSRASDIMNKQVKLDNHHTEQRKALLTAIGSLSLSAALLGGWSIASYTGERIIDKKIDQLK